MYLLVEVLEVLKRVCRTSDKDSEPGKEANLVGTPRRGC